MRRPNRLLGANVTIVLRASGQAAPQASTGQPHGTGETAIGQVRRGLDLLREGAFAEAAALYEDILASAARLNALRVQRAREAVFLDFMPYILAPMRVEQVARISDGTAEVYLRLRPDPGEGVKDPTEADAAWAEMHDLPDGLLHTPISVTVEAHDHCPVVTYARYHLFHGCEVTAVIPAGVSAGVPIGVCVTQPGILLYSGSAIVPERSHR